MIATLDEQVEQMMQPFCAQRELTSRSRGSQGMALRRSSAKSAPIQRPGSPPTSIWLPGRAVPRQPRIGRQTPSRSAPQGQPASAAGPGRVRLGRGAHRRVLREFYRRQGPPVRRVPQPSAKKKAIVAVAHKLILIVWHVLATDRPYQDLGADYFTTRIDPGTERRRRIAKLEAHGFKVTLEPAT